ncbi:MAG: hypothetical protein QM760_07515 [Nibricoccus sp.]
MEDEPSIAVGPLKIWVHGRQFPDAHDYWDGNWLSVTARCEGAGSRVQVTDPFIHLGELKKWKEDISVLARTLKGSVELPTIEPTLKVKIADQGTTLGQFSVEIDLGGDHISERHHFSGGLDQSYFAGLLAQLSAILRAYPVR